MGMSFKGIDNLQSQLRELENSARRLEGENEILLEDLLSPEFMEKYTKFSNYSNFFDASPTQTDSIDAIEDTSSEEMEEFVSENTVFDDLDEMLQKAGEEWVVDQLRIS